MACPQPCRGSVGLRREESVWERPSHRPSRSPSGLLSSRVGNVPLCTSLRDAENQFTSDAADVVWSGDRAQLSAASVELSLWCSLQHLLARSRRHQQFSQASLRSGVLFRVEGGGPGPKLRCREGDEQRLSVAAPEVQDPQQHTTPQISEPALCEDPRLFCHNCFILDKSALIRFFVTWATFSSSFSRRAFEVCIF